MKRGILLFVVIALSGCATSGDFEVLRRDINDLKRESMEARKEIDVVRERTANTVKEDSFTAVRENQADINARMVDITSSIRELRGRFEEHKYHLEKTLKESASDRDILRAQITAVESQLKALKDKLTILEDAEKARVISQQQSDNAATGEKTGQSPDAQISEQSGQIPAGKEPPPPAATEVSGDRTSAYEFAYQAFKDRKYGMAREKFEAFIRDFPKNELTDNAQFWIAETYYSERDYEGAILAYESVLKKYPESEKTSGSLLKQGFAFIELGDAKTGRAILGKLIEKFPDSKEAELAKKKMSEAERKTGRKK